MKTDILTICGSLRKASFNRQLLGAFEEIAPQDWTFTAAPPLDALDHYNQDIEEKEGFPAKVTEFAEAIRAADAVVIASPEYNFSVPGVLKNALDWLSRLDDQPFKEKPVSIVSASLSPMGGIRGQLALRQVLLALQADLTSRPEVAVAFASDRFVDGKLEHEQTRDVIEAHIGEFEALLSRHFSRRNSARAA